MTTNYHFVFYRDMASRCLGRKLVACLLNVSESRRKDLVEMVAKAALYNTEGKFRLCPIQYYAIYTLHYFLPFETSKSQLHHVCLCVYM